MAKVTQARQRAWRIARACPPAVFVIGHVAHIVQSILDAPMATVERQQLCRVGLSPSLAADQIDALNAGCVFADLKHLALHTGDLLCIGKAHIAVEQLATPNAPRLYPTMTLVQSDMLKGEMPPCGGWQYRL